MRLAFHVALIASLLYCPWWTVMVLILAGSFVLENFYEAVVYGIVIDAVYGTSFGFFGFQYVATLFSLVVFIFASLIRTRLAW